MKFSRVRADDWEKLNESALLGKYQSLDDLHPEIAHGGICGNDKAICNPHL
jgi:hypothetical protein